MSLACLMCQNVMRTDSDLRTCSFSSLTEDDGRWNRSNAKNNNGKKKNNHESNRSFPIADKDNVVVKGGLSAEAEADPSPRLMRCRAVRRDIFRDFRAEDLSLPSPSSCSLTITGQQAGFVA